MKMWFDEIIEELWYAPVSDRLVIYVHGGFFTMPGMAIGDGKLYIMSYDRFKRWKDHGEKIVRIGEYRV